MRRTGVLLAAVALVVSGCGGSKASPGTADTSAPPDHATSAAQKAVLTKALARFRSAGSGSYESEVTADDVSEPLAHETGSYQLTPAAAQLERAILGIDQASSQPRVQVVRLRSLANATSFLQLKEWGSWTGCWLPVDRSTITRLTGVDVSRTSSLPTAIIVLAKARVVGAGDGMDGPHLAVDAFSALQFLGVTNTAITAQRKALENVIVPVLLDVTADGEPSGATVEGTQVAGVLKDAGITLPDAAQNYVTKAHAQVVLDSLGKPVHVLAPSAAERLPKDPPRTSTCPAND